MKESIEKIDISYSNGSGGHTANVNTVLDSKNLDGSNGLGIVIGRLGEVSSFSNEKVASMLKNFVCTTETIAADPTKKNKSRKYVDKTSLLLKSYVVLVRGKDCGPESANFEGPVPYFTEVAGSPLRSYKKSGAVVDGSTILLGSIYNTEAGTMYDGTKCTLVYQGKDLVDELCINDHIPSFKYKASPDLSQYDLQYGYTVNELKAALNQIGIIVEGLVDSDKVLFEDSGTIDGILSSIGSYFGYFWFVDPESGNVKFVSTEQASTITLTDFTNSSDENIINASFTTSATSTKIVNIYQGSSEKPKERDRGSPPTGGRNRRMFFKRIFMERLAGIFLDTETLGAFFALFNQRTDADTFDKFTFFLTYMNRSPKVGAGRSISEQLFKKKLDISKLYKEEPRYEKMVKFGHTAIGNPNLESIYPNVDIAKQNRDTKLRGAGGAALDRITDKFIYYRLAKGIFAGPPAAAGDSNFIPMTRPSTTKLYDFLKAFYAICGGFFVSNGYSQYRADRVEWQNNNNVTIAGPFKNTVRVSEIPELSDLNDFLELLNIRNPTIGDLADRTNGEAKTIFPFHFVAIRNLKDREKFKDDDALDFEGLQNQIEFIDNPATKKGELFMGGPSKVFRKTFLTDYLKGLVIQSVKNFLSTVDNKKTISCNYVRSKTRLLDDDEEGAEAEDNALASSSEGNQKMADLSDRYDLKFFNVQSPSHDITNQLSISSASGSTIEMKALQKMRGTYNGQSESPSSSSRTLYGLHVPSFSPTMSSLSINVGPQGITTTINESTIKLIPKDNQLLINRGIDVGKTNPLTSQLNASQRNFFGL